MIEEDATLIWEAACAAAAFDSPTTVASGDGRSNIKFIYKTNINE